MADFYSITLEEMDAFMRSRRFQPVDLTYRNRPVKEWVYQRPLPRSPNHWVRIYTGINRYGRSQNQSRGVGKDAIRVQVIYNDGNVETLVTQPKRVHRVTGWADNLDKRLSEIAQSLPQVAFDRRGEPMTLRRKDGKYFWGSRDYPRYKETRPFQAESEQSAPLAGQTTEALYEIKIYVPSTNLDQPVSETEFQSRIVETQKKLSELFGGFTTAVGDGGYLSQEEGLISEPVMIVTSWANSTDYQKKLGELESFLREKQQDWGQEVIGFEFENDFFMYPAFETYEAPYQPDQTMQDYSLSELTNSSAISGYQPYKYSASHGAEEIRCCKECDKTTGLTTIQAGTYCYDCLPINLGAEDRLDYQNYLNDLRTYPELKNLSDEQLLARGIDCLASQTANRETFAAEERFYYHSTDMTNLESILKEGIRPTADTNSIWGEEIIDISPYPYYYGEIDDILPSVFVADSPEEARWWADEAGIDKIVVLKISSQVENLENFHGDGNGYKTSETIPKEYIVGVIGETFAAEDNYDATYGTAQAKIRRKLKNKIMKQAIMGTKAGQWSARKSQELKRQYEAACEKRGLAAYKGKKTKSQDNLSKWSQQKWKTASGKKSSTTGEPYFPAKAVAALKKKDLYAKAKRQKAKATKAGKQNARYSDDIRAVVKKYRTEWEDIDWDNSTPSETPQDWGDDVTWQDDWGSLRPETRPEFPTLDARIAAMLRNHSKVNVNGEQGCPVCGTEDLFYRESTGTGTKWYCYGCFYTEKTESQKSQKIETLEKYGLQVKCPDCGEMISAYNQASVNSHRRKCGVSK